MRNRAGLDAGLDAGLSAGLSAGLDADLGSSFSFNVYIIGQQNVGFL